MPIYEYKCENTGKVYEVRQSINAEPLTNCTMPNCECGGKSPAHRLISKNVGIVFHGSGFYETDYKHPHPEPKSEQCCACADSHTCGHSH
ncbi:MAG: zinc ribbon domain-containing protein [Ignavibacteria bacterium]|jgi:putative FmdB family regulatory protein|nr:zinc ribbon domain-containing protein [Ignavibacteria bacterium]